MWVTRALEPVGRGVAYSDWTVWVMCPLTGTTLAAQDYYEMEGRVSPKGWNAGQKNKNKTNKKNPSIPTSLCVTFWIKHYWLTRASWEYRIHPDHHPTNVTRHLPPSKSMLPFMKVPFLVTTPHLKFLSTYPLICRCYFNNNHIYWAFILCQAVLYKLYMEHAGLSLQQPTCNHYPHLYRRENRNSGRSAQGHTAQGYRSKQDAPAPPLMLLTNQL